MISLTSDGKALPSALLAGTSYDVHVSIDGTVALYSEWHLLSGVSTIDQGSGKTFRLSIRNTGVYYLHVKALGNTGQGEESIFPLSVSSRRVSPPSLGIKWSSYQASPGDKLSATLVYNDPEGGGANHLTWSLYFNSNLIASESSNTVTIQSAQHGVYRVVASVAGATGSLVTADSTVIVTGNYEILSAITGLSGENTLHHIGSVYSKTMSAAATNATYLPYEVASFQQDAVLLPGTTHIRFVLDPALGVVDDEIIVRTKSGNWAVVGPPTGLATESLPYDYALGNPYIPAPIDLRTAYTVDVWNVHGASVAASRFRLKIECYCSGSPVYQYTPCVYSEYLGGAGQRQRRLVAIVEKLDVDLDAVHGFHRGGLDATVTYTTPIPLRVIVTASALGTPCTQQPESGTTLTEANIVAVYDPAPGTGLPLLEAKGVYGTSGIRPYTFNLNIPKDVPIVQRVRRAYGTLALYVANGGVNEGAVARVRINRNASPGYVDYSIPVSDVYNPESTVFEKIGEVQIDVSDYGFSIGGMVIGITLNEVPTLDPL